MPLLCDGEPQSSVFSQPEQDDFSRVPPTRKQSQHSFMAKSAILSSFTHSSPEGAEERQAMKDQAIPSANKLSDNSTARSAPPRQNSLGAALSDTPSTTAPNSPKIRATTLDIPGLTKSKVSPDGRIAQRDVGAKLVIVMVGLPARGKSYVTKKMARYLNWLQHDTKIFNVGERRRVVAGGPNQLSPAALPKSRQTNGRRTPELSIASLNGILHHRDLLGPPAISAEPVDRDTLPEIHVESVHPLAPLSSTRGLSARARQSDTITTANGQSNENPSKMQKDIVPHPTESRMLGTMEQTANFFDPNNTKASQIREQCAMATLDDLLDYILDQGGSVGIFDATNSTLERRKMIMKKIRERAGPELGVLFLESLCVDENLLESNMRLKLSGPDYKDKDPVKALADFRERVALYESKYVPLGDYEERNNMPYVQMIDVGRKIVSHQIRGFLSAQTVYYLLNFNLSPRQIWITRHGESVDNVNGKIGGDSDLSENGHLYAKALTRFIRHERQVWEVRQQERARNTHFPPLPGDTTPPNPEYSQCGNGGSEHLTKSFCVWTSMLKRSVQTAQYFDEEEFDLKQMRMLDELNAGTMEGMTYDQIKSRFAEEYELRKKDKLHYRYPGAGGESYLDIINRLRAVIVEVERTTDHVLLVGHRSVARILLAYFKGLKRDEVADLDVPLGMLYMLEPKPYGVEFKAYRYNNQTDWFDHVPGYELRTSDLH